MPIHEQSLIRPENLTTHDQLVVDGVDVSGHWSTFIQTRVISDYNEAMQDEIAALPGGENVHRCWQCGSCTNSCTVNAINPGLVASDRAKAVLGDEGLAAYGATVPVGRAGTPADIAHAALFLASARSDYITGTTIKMDGGSTVAASPGRNDILQDRLKLQHGKAP